MSKLHDCAKAGCGVRPDEIAWAKPPVGTEAVVWDNNAGKLVTRAAAARITPKDDPPEG